MTNFVPPNQTLILKGFRKGTSQQEIEDFCKNLTPDFNVRRDEKAVVSKYNYMATSTMQAKNKRDWPKIESSPISKL